MTVARAVVLEQGRVRAEVDPVGATLRQVRVGDLDLLDNEPDEPYVSDGRGQLLVPWPNRIRDGRYRHAGQQHQLPLTEPGRGHAIHGLARYLRWSVSEGGGACVRLHHDLPAQAGYPFRLHLEAAYRLTRAGVAVEVTITSTGPDPAPCGLGAHPYIKAGPGDATLDACQVQAPAEREILTDDRMIPTDTATVSRDHDCRQWRPLQGLSLDTGYTGLLLDDDGRCRVRLRRSDGVVVCVTLGEGVDYLMLFSGDGLPDPEHRRRGLGVEPMTCAPDAFNNGWGLRVLGPGEHLRMEWTIEREPHDANR